MYIPTWLIVIIAIVAFFIYKSKKKASSTGALERTASVEDIENSINFLKERIFELEHFDSPHFIDCQDAFDVMEINYLKLKQRFFHTPEKVLEIAKDWHRYVEALGDLKHARVMLDVDWEDDAWDRIGESMKEPSIIKEEIEKKFKPLLGDDWQEIPPDYFKRMETMKKPDEKTEAHLGLGNDWKYYYMDSANLFKLEEKREKEKKEREIKKEEEKEGKK